MAGSVAPGTDWLRGRYSRRAAPWGGRVSQGSQVREGRAGGFLGRGKAAREHGAGDQRGMEGQS